MKSEKEQKEQDVERVIRSRAKDDIGSIREAMVIAAMIILAVGATFWVFSCTPDWQGRDLPALNIGGPR